jgi:RNA polymerase sigma factor (sigma-70 family)
VWRNAVFRYSPYSGRDRLSTLAFKLERGSCMDESLDTWFAQEVLVHEGPLVRYLSRTWPAQDEIHGLRQETYLRVYEAAAKERPRLAKSFLFATARQLLVDQMHLKGMPPSEARWELEDLRVVIGEISPEHTAGADEELRALAHALNNLPPQYRQVVRMRRVEAQSQKEVAARLGIEEAMVQKRLAKAIRSLADAVWGYTPINNPKGGAAH